VDEAAGQQEDDSNNSNDDEEDCHESSFVWRSKPVPNEWGGHFDAIEVIG
jgi:hypothetical protein